MMFSTDTANVKKEKKWTTEQHLFHDLQKKQVLEEDEEAGIKRRRNIGRWVLTQIQMEGIRGN